MTSDAASAARAERIGLWWLIACAVCIGCGSIPAYQRGRLAHPTMAAGFAESPARAHREAVQEGAVGGGARVASGCGCN